VHHKFLVLFFSTFLVVGCTKVNSFEARIENIDANKISVNCSHLIKNENKEYSNDILHLCNVEVSEETIIADERGDTLNINKLNIGDNIKIILTKPQSINKNIESRNIIAKEIILLK
jgi:hypothetical protein